MGKGTSEKLWCIKIISQAAYLFKGGKKVDCFNHIVGAEVSETEKSANSPQPSPSSRMLVKLEFSPSINNTYQYGSLNPRYFNKFDCDGEFKYIDANTAESVAKEISRKLEDLAKLAKLSAISGIEETTPIGSQETEKAQQSKRQLTPLFSACKSSEPKPKRKKVESSSIHHKGIEDECNNCRLDNKTHFIPIEKLEVPPKQRQIRAVDKGFLNQLVDNMKHQPAGNYEALFVVVKDLDNKKSFKLDKIADYQYEVLGGTHLTLATKELHSKNPENPNYQGRVARIYVGLTDTQALWLGALHNHTGAFRHSITYIDELEICRTQLFPNMQDCSGDPPQPSDTWRDMCSSLLNKSKRNLSEVFSLAQLPEEAWKHFKTLVAFFERGELKGQKIKPTDIVKKGKPVLKQWQMKVLCSLLPEDRTFLLKKVAEKEMSLEDLKVAAVQIKSLRPIQEAILLFFKLGNWEEANEKFGKEVAAEKLLRFTGKNYEESYDFQRFLERLKGNTERDGEMYSADIIRGNSGANGLIIFSETLNEVNMNAVTKLPRYEGAFLTIGDAGDDSENASEVIEVASRVNFTKLSSFNVVLLTSIDDVKDVKSKMEEGGATFAQTGHFFVQNKPKMTSKQGSLMRDVLITFVVGHWSISRQVTSRHLSGQPDNVKVLDYKVSQEALALEANEWLVETFSHEGDSVLCVNCPEGSLMVAALKQGRNAVWISTALPEEQPALQTGLAKLMRTDDNNLNDQDFTNLDDEVDDDVLSGITL